MLQRVSRPRYYRSPLRGQNFQQMRSRTIRYPRARLPSRHMVMHRPISRPIHSPKQKSIFSKILSALLTILCLGRNRRGSLQRRNPYGTHGRGGGPNITIGGVDPSGIFGGDPFGTVGGEEPFTLGDIGFGGGDFDIGGFDFMANSDGRGKRIYYGGEGRY